MTVKPNVYLHTVISVTKRFTLISKKLDFCCHFLFLQQQ